IGSLLGAGLAGVLAAVLALLACWCVHADRRGQVPAQMILFLIVSLLWVISGPVAGLGLEDTIALLARFGRDSLIAQVLYLSNSPRAVWWAYLLRGFPFAVAVVWPIMRLLPEELRAAARLEGASPWRELLWVTVPLALPAGLGAAVVVMALSLAEVSASKFVA